MVEKLERIPILSRVKRRTKSRDEVIPRVIILVLCDSLGSSRDGLEVEKESEVLITPLDVTYDVTSVGTVRHTAQLVVLGRSAQVLVQSTDTSKTCTRFRVPLPRFLTKCWGFITALASIKKKYMPDKVLQISEKFLPNPANLNDLKVFK